MMRILLNQIKRIKWLKKTLKRLYQIFFYSISKKVKVNGDLFCINPNDGYEYFFGYYDKSPWDITDKYILGMRVKNAHEKPASKEIAQIVMFNSEDEYNMEILSNTTSWNSQQGAMLQWLGPDFRRLIIFNDFRNGKYCSVIYDVLSKKEVKIIDLPIYEVDKDGNFAYSIDFNRLNTFRPGYGYSNSEDATRNIKVPNGSAIKKINLETGKVEELINYSSLVEHETNKSMKNAFHKINHLMISPNGEKMIFLHRWYKNKIKYSRLILIDIKSKKMKNLSDEEFVSHCYWKDNDYIIGYMRKDGTDGYYLINVNNGYYQHILQELKSDGHCSYSFDNKYIITDTYPNKKRMMKVFLCNELECSTILEVFSPFKYDNDVRCDLHPRWNHLNSKICIDSTHSGKRGLYLINIEDNYKEVLK